MVVTVPKKRHMPAVCRVCYVDIYPCNDRYRYKNKTICDNVECLTKAAGAVRALIVCRACGTDLIGKEFYIVNGQACCKNADCIAKAMGATRIDD